MESQKQLKTSLERYLSGFKKSKAVTCFTISNTAKKADQYYFTPVRAVDDIQVCGVVVNNALEAKEFATLADGRFDYIAVDSEKKIEPARYASPDDSGNLEGEILDVVKKSKVIDFKANDITVNALDIFISNKLMGVAQRKVAVVGVGNIGFKLALKLLERGCWINLYRRDQVKLKLQTACLNMTKPKGTLATVTACRTLLECISDVHMVVATADSSNIISLKDLKTLKNDPILVDCGKGCFADEVCNVKTVYRTDVGMALLYQLKMVIASNEKLHTRFGKKVVEDQRYVCGVCGLGGDVVLGDINDLNSIIGVCDGRGGLRPR